MTYNINNHSVLLIRTMHPINFDKPIFGKYEVRSKLKVGGFGSVYRARGVGTDSNLQYAVKVMPKKFEKYARIEHELYEVIKKAEYTLGFVKHYEYGKIDDKIYLVMELVGQDLEEIMFKRKTNKLTPKTGVMIGLQLIDRLEALHKIGYLHRDVKPDNLTIGFKQNATVIYLIDFGLAKKMKEPLPPEEKGKVIGTLAYMSIRMHDGKQPGILDDLESFVYTIVYLIHGTLPWMHVQVQQAADYQKIKILKEKLSKPWFQKHKIPTQLFEALQIIRGHQGTKFDYLKIKYKLLSALTSMATENDFAFDWCCESEPKTKSPKKNIEERKLVKKMNEDNQKIVQKEIYEIYKFMDHENKEEKKQSPKKVKERNDAKAKVEENQIVPKKKIVERPKSSVNPRKKNDDNGYQKQLQKQLKLIESMKCEGPKIVINRTAVHKI